MLDFFLVLGIVPGTSFVLTFNEILLVFSLVVTALWLYAGRRPKISIKQEVAQLSRLHSFSYPIPAKFSQPEEPTAHKAEVPLANIVLPHLSRVVRLIRRAA